MIIDMLLTQEARAILCGTAWFLFALIFAWVLFETAMISFRVNSED